VAGRSIMCRRRWGTRAHAHEHDLHSSEMGLQESMRRFDTARGKPVAKADAIEQPPVATGNSKSLTKARYTSGYSNIAPVAQRIEHPPPKRGAAGSIPAGRAII
jgi:hypothetical protein